MRVHYRRSVDWLASEMVRLGRTLTAGAHAEIDPAHLSASSREAIVAGHACYPEDFAALDGMTFATDQHPEDVTPADVDRMIEAALAAIAQRRAEQEAREARERAERESRQAAQTQVIEAFLADPSARPTAACLPHWITLREASEDIRPAHPLFAALCAAVAERERADADAQRAAAADRERAAQAVVDRLAAQIEAWVQAHGDTSQRARHAEQVLPRAEVIEAIRSTALEPGRGFDLYRKITAAELHECCEADWCPADASRANFSVDHMATLTAEQYATLCAVREAFPGAEVTPRRHTGEWDCGVQECPLHTVSRCGVRVHVVVGEVHAVAEYAL